MAEIFVNPHEEDTTVYADKNPGLTRLIVYILLGLLFLVGCGLAYRLVMLFS